MHAQTLTKSVPVYGRSLFGTQTGSIRFVPVPNGPGSHAWSWNGIPIHTATFLRRLRQISLADGGEVFSVFEHVGALAMSRVRGVNILTGGVIPFIPHAGEIWSQMKPLLKEQPDTPIYSIEPASGCTYYCGKRRDRFISYAPSGDHRLTIHVCVDYPDIGRLERTYVLPDDAVLDRIYSARTLGRLPAPFGVLEPLVERVLRTVPVVANAVWKHQYLGAREELLGIIADHRCLDILGALSLATPPGFYLAGAIHSVKGGHACDLELVEFLRRQWLRA